MNKTNIVIPMAGLGKRFLDCGYELPKPFLPLGNKSMIENVIENLNHPDFIFTFIVNTKQLDVTELANKINQIISNYIKLPNCRNRLHSSRSGRISIIGRNKNRYSITSYNYQL